jgi:hypothetical protein
VCGIALIVSSGLVSVCVRMGKDGYGWAEGISNEVRFVGLY